MAWSAEPSKALNSLHTRGVRAARSQFDCEGKVFQRMAAAPLAGQGRRTVYVVGDQPDDNFA